MTEVVGPNLIVNPDDIDIADFIIASNGLDKVMKNQVSLYHHGDFVTVAVTQKAADHMKVDLSRIVATFHFVTMVNYKVTKDVSWDTQADAKPITLTNSEQANHWDIVVAFEKISVRADDVVDENGVVQPNTGESTAPSGNQISLDDRNNQPEPFDATPWIIGVVVIVVAAALIYWFFLRGKTVFGHTFGAPKAVGAAPVAPAPAPAPPAPAQVVK
jgi:hypothetical protein